MCLLGRGLGRGPLWLTSLLHPLAWSADPVGPALSTVVPFLRHTEVALVTAAHGVLRADALSPRHQAHGWDHGQEKELRAAAMVVVSAPSPGETKPRAGQHLQAWGLLPGV